MVVGLVNVTSHVLALAPLDYFCHVRVGQLVSSPGAVVFVVDNAVCIHAQINRLCRNHILNQLREIERRTFLLFLTVTAPDFALLRRGSIDLFSKDLIRSVVAKSSPKNHQRHVEAHLPDHKRQNPNND
jgi:hypothetical protein